MKEKLKYSVGDIIWVDTTKGIMYNYIGPAKINRIIPCEESNLKETAYSCFFPFGTPLYKTSDNKPISMPLYLCEIKYKIS